MVRTTIVILWGVFLFGAIPNKVAAWGSKNQSMAQYKYYRNQTIKNSNSVRYKKKLALEECRRSKRLRSVQVIQGKKFINQALLMDPCARIKVVRGVTMVNRKKLQSSYRNRSVAQLKAQCYLPNDRIDIRHTGIINTGVIEGSEQVTQTDFRYCNAINFQSTEVINKGRIQTVNPIQQFR